MKLVDYQELFREAQERVELYGEKHWTNFNLGSPGVALLEQLIGALVEVRNLEEKKIKDLYDYETKLDPQSWQGNPIGEPVKTRYHHLGERLLPLNYLFELETILTGDPVTLGDFCAYLMQLKQVVNCWVEVSEGGHLSAPVLNAWLRFAFGCSPLVKQNIFEEAKAKLNQIRPLGLKIGEVKEVLVKRYGLRAQLRLELGKSPIELFALALFQVKNLLSPVLNLYGFYELKAAGYYVEDIIQGPQATRGWLNPELLDNEQKKTGISLDQLTQTLLKIDGVLSVNRLALVDEEGQLIPLVEGYWQIDPKIQWWIDLEHCQLSCHLGNQSIKVNPHQLKEAFAQKIDQAYRPDPLKDHLISQKAQLGHQTPPSFLSIQADLPEYFYNLSANGKRLPQETHSLQLRAFLRIFDQLLADRSRLTTHCRDLFSTAPRTHTRSLGKVIGSEFEDQLWGESERDLELSLQNSAEPLALAKKNSWALLKHQLASLGYSPPNQGGNKLAMQRFLAYWPKLSGQRGRGQGLGQSPLTLENRPPALTRVLWEGAVEEPLIGLAQQFYITLEPDPQGDKNKGSYLYHFSLLQKAGGESLDSLIEGTQAFGNQDDLEWVLLQCVIFGREAIYYRTKEVVQESQPMQKRPAFRDFQRGGQQVLGFMTSSSLNLDFDSESPKEGEYSFELVNPNQEVLARSNCYKRASQRNNALEQTLNRLKAIKSPLPLYFIEHTHLEPNSPLDLPEGSPASGNPWGEADFFQVAGSFFINHNLLKNAGFALWREQVSKHFPAYFYPHFFVLQSVEFQQFEVLFLTWLLTRQDESGDSLKNLLEFYGSLRPEV
ncbi:MAG: hypothetical protein A2527_00890 [Candidatus Lambdaproteobacteria bacterium RIFOXYD2_FULL_50_16]|uniref:Uncharacterized protein n=1 Tax=Candidatus Lambdaproteobacteria bacterium RIFOXYD2_FULL_50_16 TaxID=1817772 RepID=A0A1F6G8Y3_9PROT|nr:MAG: hypothetical protein A2527_00890 [Candidatus Lambdaproteobacteria bacterium RIFOXYD2_FULL_50_16]